jgi:hypothetical protein
VREGSLREGSCRAPGVKVTPESSGERRIWPVGVKVTCACAAGAMATAAIETSETEARRGVRRMDVVSVAGNVGRKIAATISPGVDREFLRRGPTRAGRDDQPMTTTLKPTAVSLSSLT